MSTEPLPVTGAWQPTDPTGMPSVLHVRQRPPVRARERRRAPRRHDRLRDVGRAQRRSLERRARLPRMDRRQPRLRPRGHGPQRAGLVVRRHRSGLGARHRSVVRRVRQRARRVPGLDRSGVAAPDRRSPVRLALPGRHDPRHGARPGPPDAAPRSRVVARGRRRLDGRDAGSRVGDHVSRVGSARSRRSRRACRRPPNRSRGVRSGGARSVSTHAGGAATTTTPSPATARARVSPIARQIAQVTFRSDNVFTDRFGRDLADRPAFGDTFGLWQQFEVERYLEYHGDELVRRFDANSYLVIGKAMDLHDIARSRGSVESAMARITVPSLAIGISSDMLYPSYQQRQIHELLTSAGDAELVRRGRLTARPRRVPDQRRSGQRTARQVPRPRRLSAARPSRHVAWRRIASSTGDRAARRRHADRHLVGVAALGGREQVHLAFLRRVVGLRRERATPLRCGGSIVSAAWRRSACRR